MSDLMKQFNIKDKNGVIHQFEVKDAVARQEIDSSKELLFDESQFTITETNTEVNIKTNVFSGATTTENCGVGLVPSAAIADRNKYLNGAGQWTNVIKTPIEKITITTTESSLIISPKEYTFTDYGKLPATLTELQISLPEYEDFLYEVGFQFEVQSDSLVGTLITTKELKYTNWPDTFEQGSVYQISIVNNCVSVGEFKDLEI